MRPTIRGTGTLSRVARSPPLTEHKAPIHSFMFNSDFQFQRWVCAHHKTGPIRIEKKKKEN